MKAEIQRKQNILQGFIQKKAVTYPLLLSCIGMYLWMKPMGVMIAPDVFLRAGVVFLYLAIMVLPYPFVFIFPLVGLILSTHPFQTFVVLGVSTQVCFFASRLLPQLSGRKIVLSKLAAVILTTYTAQLVCTIFKSAAEIMPFFTYLPLGMIKASTNVVGAVVIIPVALMLLERFGIIDFRREYEGLVPELNPRGISIFKG